MRPKGETSRSHKAALRDALAVCGPRIFNAGLPVMLVNSARLQVFLLSRASGLLSEDVLQALDVLGADLVCIRPGPGVCVTTPGACGLCMEFDLSDRAVQLLLAAGACERHGV